MAPLLILISGPSGVGKDAVAGKLVREHPDRFSFVLTSTTRAPRSNEKDGVDYRFVDRSRFEALIREDKLFEWAEVYGNYYGSGYGSIEEVLASGRHAVMRIDVQGATRIKQLVPDALCIFLMPTSEAALRKRLAQRDGEGSEDFNRRVEVALDEIPQLYNQKDRRLVYNKDGELDATVAEVLRIVDNKSGEEHDTLLQLRRKPH